MSVWRDGAERGRLADMAGRPLSAPVPNLAVLIPNLAALIPNLAALNSLLSKSRGAAPSEHMAMKAFTMTKETMANAKKQALLLRNRHIARKSSLVIVSPRI